MTPSPARKALSLLVMTAAAAALAACGGGDSSASGATSSAAGDSPAPASSAASPSPEASPDAGSSEACDLLDSAKLASISGLPFGGVAPKGTTGEGRSTCEWALDGAQMAMFQVSVLDAGGYTIADQRKVSEGMFKDIEDVTVAGAPGAFTYMGGWTLAMVEDDEYLTLTYTSQGKKDTPVLVALAEEIIARH